MEIYGIICNQKGEVYMININKDLRELYKYVERKNENPTLNELFFDENRNIFNYEPPYQRNYVWSIEKATNLIETIIINGEIPPITITKINNEVEIIDGKQRYMSIMNFCNNKFKLKNSGLNLLPELEGCTYLTLPPNIQEILKDFKLKMIVYGFKFGIEYPKECENYLKRDLFRRYNSGMTSLSKNEVARASYAYDNLSKLFEQKILAELDKEKNSKEADEKKIAKDHDTEILDNDKIYIKFINTFISKSKRKHAKRELINLTLVNIRELLTIPYISIIDSKSVSLTADVIDTYYNRYVINNNDNEIIEKLENITKKVAEIKEHLVFLNNPIQDNILFFKAIYWMLSILYDYFPNEYYKFNCDQFSKYIENHPETNIYFDNYKNMTSNSIISRYEFMKNYLSSELNIEITEYLQKLRDEKEKYRRKPKKIIKSNEAWEGINRIHNIISKETTFKIKDIAYKIEKGRFFVRPFYQREEVVNKAIASRIIESIILGIKLPPVYIYTRIGTDGIPVYEVIDGQQRIISILSYIGQLINDADGNLVRSKKHKFKLTDLRNSQFINNKNCDEIGKINLDKILDYELDCVEIRDSMNIDFSPIDMFLRLNSKPYPILYNSFEMWNSFECVNILDKIKKISNIYGQNILRQNGKKMKNEELITTLSYLEFKNINIKNMNEVLKVYIYLKDNEIKMTFDKKYSLTNLLETIDTDKETENCFMNDIALVENFMEKIELLFNKNYDNLIKILNPYIETPRKGSAKDFYLLYLFLKNLNTHIINTYKEDILNDIQSIYRFMKKIPENKQAEDFIKYLLQIIYKYDQYR